MRVLWLSPGFAADEADTNCIPPLQMLARELQTLGVDLHIIALGYPFHHQPYRWHGISVVSGYGWNARSLRWLNWLRVLRCARQAHRELPFQAIHSFWLGPCRFIGERLARRWKVPHITTLMGQDVLPDNYYRRLLHPKAGKNLVALCDYQNARFEQTNGFRAAHTIHWGLDALTTPDSAATHRPIHLLGCGAFIPLKNWALWLDTAALLQKSIPGFRAVLIGEGILRAELEKRAQALGLADCLQFTGHLPRAEVLAYMRSARVLLHTARFEAFGMVLTEAADAGCRLVSTPVGIAPELARCAQTPAELAEGVRNALQQAGANTLPPHFSMRNTAEQYRALYVQ